MAVSRAVLLQGCDLGTDEVEVEGIGTVRLRSPTFAEWYPIMLEQAKHEGAHVPAEAVGRVIAAVLSDEDGNRLLSDNDVAALLSSSPSKVLRLYEVCKGVIAKAVGGNAEAVAGN